MRVLAIVLLTHPAGAHVIARAGRSIDVSPRTGTMVEALGGCPRVETRGLDGEPQRQAPEGDR
jgi:hypothetical protein